MNHFSYPLTIVQIYIFEEPQNVFPNQIPDPKLSSQAPVLLTTDSPPLGKVAKVKTTLLVSMNDFMIISFQEKKITT